MVDFFLDFCQDRCEGDESDENLFMVDFVLDFCQHRCEEDESDELGFYFCKPALQNLAKLPGKFDWSLSKLILPEVDLFKHGN